MAVKEKTKFLNKGEYYQISKNIIYTLAHEKDYRFLSNKVVILFLTFAYFYNTKKHEDLECVFDYKNAQTHLGHKTIINPNEMLFNSTLDYKKVFTKTIPKQTFGNKPNENKYITVMKNAVYAMKHDNTLEEKHMTAIINLLNNYRFKVSPELETAFNKYCKGYISVHLSFSKIKRDTLTPLSSVYFRFKGYMIRISNHWGSVSHSKYTLEGENSIGYEDYHIGVAHCKDILRNDTTPYCIFKRFGFILNKIEHKKNKIYYTVHTSIDTEKRLMSLVKILMAESYRFHICENTITIIVGNKKFIENYDTLVIRKLFGYNKRS